MKERKKGFLYIVHDSLMEAVLNKTATAMGQRTMKKWFLQPLIDKKAILQRQTMVQYFKTSDHRILLHEVLKKMPNLQNLNRKFSVKADLQDYFALDKVFNFLIEVSNSI